MSTINIAGNLGNSTFIFNGNNEPLKRAAGQVPGIIEKMTKGAMGHLNAFTAGFVASFGVDTARAFKSFATNSIITGAQFEKAMSGVRAVTDATDGQMRSLEALALKLGKDTTFSAREVAAAMNELGTAGLRTEQIIQSMPGILDLAAAGNMDVALAAQVATTAMNNFGLKADSTSRVVDVLTKAALDSQTTVQGLGESFKFIGPVAHGFGKSIEETAAALEILANAGMRNEMGGTGLRSLLSNLSGEGTVPVRKFFDAAGIDQAKFKTKSLADQIDILRQKLGTGADAAGKLIKAFNPRGGTALINLMKAGGDQLRELTAGLQNAEGTARKTAKVMTDNLMGAWEQFTGAVETAQIDFTKKFEPEILRFIRWLTEQVEQVPNIAENLFKNWDTYLAIARVNWMSFWEDVVQAAARGASAYTEAVKGMFTNPVQSTKDVINDPFGIKALDAAVAAGQARTMPADNRNAFQKQLDEMRETLTKGLAGNPATRPKVSPGKQLFPSISGQNIEQFSPEVVSGAMDFWKGKLNEVTAKVDEATDSWKRAGANFYDFVSGKDAAVDKALDKFFGPVDKFERKTDASLDSRVDRDLDDFFGPVERSSGKKKRRGGTGSIGFAGGLEAWQLIASRGGGESNPVVRTTKDNTSATEENTQAIKQLIASRMDNKNSGYFR